MPPWYSVMRLAETWNCPPHVVEEAPVEWVIRGLRLEAMRASVKVHRSK